MLCSNFFQNFFCSFFSIFKIIGDKLLDKKFKGFVKFCQIKYLMITNSSQKFCEYDWKIEPRNIAINICQISDPLNEPRKEINMQYVKNQQFYY